MVALARVGMVGGQSRNGQVQESLGGRVRSDRIRRTQVQFLLGSGSGQLVEAIPLPARRTQEEKRFCWGWGLLEV